MDDLEYNQSSAFLDSQVYATREKLRIYSDLSRKGNDMGCLGVHFAITEAEAEMLISLGTDDARLEYVQEHLEEAYFGGEQEWMCETDKAWDAMHRALTDGDLGYQNGEYPLNHVILGGKPLFMGDSYIMSLLSPR